jgi:hypothetical protein
LIRGNFTLDDEKTVSPFNNAFMVLKDIVYDDARIVLKWLNTGRFGYIVQDQSGHVWDHPIQQRSEHTDQRTFSLNAPSPGYVTYDGNHSNSSHLTRRFRH